MSNRIVCKHTPSHSKHILSFWRHTRSLPLFLKLGNFALTYSLIINFYVWIIIKFPKFIGTRTGFQNHVTRVRYCFPFQSSFSSKLSFKFCLRFSEFYMNSLLCCSNYLPHVLCFKFKQMLTETLIQFTDYGKGKGEKQQTLAIKSPTEAWRFSHWTIEPECWIH